MYILERIFQIVLISGILFKNIDNLHLFKILIRFNMILHKKLVFTKVLTFY